MKKARTIEPQINLKKENEQKLWKIDKFQQILAIAGEAKIPFEGDLPEFWNIPRLIFSILILRECVVGLENKEPKLQKHN